MLDISIKPISNYLNNYKKVIELLTNPVKIEQKIDGVKISLYHIDNSGNPLKDFIVAYKGQIQYPNEYGYSTDSEIRTSSIANSQFKLIFDHLKTISNYKSIPINTEIFCEFAMKKPTLSSNYSKHGLIILAYSNSSIRISNGIIKSNASGFETALRSQYSKILRIPEPPVVFEGFLKDFKCKVKLDLDSYESCLEFVSEVSKILLDLDSKFGGKEEGVVLNYPNYKVKIQQSYQVDQAARFIIKEKWRADSITEADYWNFVGKSADLLLNGIPLKGQISDSLINLSNAIKNYKITFQHPKKNLTQIKDDIQSLAKKKLIQRFEGNNNFLFLGKMRILTNAHYDIIKNGLKKYDGGVVALVSNKETKNYEIIRNQMLKAAFPSIDIINVNSGYLPSIVSKCPVNINVILCGTDRFEDYSNQVAKYLPGVKVVETPRNSSAISASKVIDLLDDFEFFKANTPKEIHKFYNSLLQIFKNSKS